MKKYFLGPANRKEEQVEAKVSWRFRLADWILKGKLFTLLNEIVFDDTVIMSAPYEAMLNDAKKTGMARIRVSKNDDGKYGPEDPDDQNETKYFLLIGKAREAEKNIAKKSAKLMVD